MKMSVAKMAFFAALASNMLNASFNPTRGGSFKNYSVAYCPKRKRFKGWQRQRREGQ